MFANDPFFSGRRQTAAFPRFRSIFDFDRDPVMTYLGPETIAPSRLPGPERNSVSAADWIRQFQHAEAPPRPRKNSHDSELNSPAPKRAPTRPTPSVSLRDPALPRSVISAGGRKIPITFVKPETTERQPSELDRNEFNARMEDYFKAVDEKPPPSATRLEATDEDRQMQEVLKISLEEHQARQRAEKARAELEAAKAAAAARQPSPPVSPRATRQREDEERMRDRLQLYDMTEKKIRGDGNCQFRSVADQVSGSEDNHAEVRKLCVDWLRKNDSYKIDASTKLSDFLETDHFPTWNDYCDYMARDASWGDHITLIALAELLQTRIWILSNVKSDEKLSPVTIIEPREVEDNRCIYLAHWHERHYSSLYPQNTRPATQNRL